MKKILLQSLALLGMGLVTHSATATPVKRIDIGEDTPTKIYAVSAGSTKGVYTLSTADANTDKISGSTYIQYSFDNSGGTFVSKEKLYGTKATDGLVPQIYAITATAEGGEDGPWSHTFYKYGYTGYIIAKDMTYVAGEDKIYGLFRTNPYNDLYQSLAVYDGEKVEATKIADLASTYTAIAADSKGELYAVSGNYGKLVKIDKTNGAVTEIGSLGVVMQSTPQSAAIDPATDKMYWVAGANAYSPQSMFEVDLTTGAATKLYDFPMGTKFQALWIPAPEADKNAPGAPENLSARFTGNGKNVQISFTAPDKTFSGNTLQGELDYTVYV
ncbi:MAG: DUF4394 domain-containing protein, partial [Muribaculaceae bacterium]|nr:DUF4394 domain-containing protein [Muribaculaceae bacterium]